jgi:hypothetical protein
LSGADWTPAWLWLAVIASGLYHGVNPGMGWPLAVSAGLMERSPRALVAALGPLTAGHLLATLGLLDEADAVVEGDHAGQARHFRKCTRDDYIALIPDVLNGFFVVGVIDIVAIRLVYENGNVFRNGTSL